MNNISNYLKNNSDIFLSTVFAILFYNLHYGIGTVIFTNINWLLKARHDWGAHYLGFSFYRISDWSFPIGNINKWYYPIQTNVGLTDSIPLFAIPFKLLSPILPQDFQYIGLFILVSYILNGYFTVKFARLFTTNKLLILFATLFVLISPIVIYRAIHPSLCAHWLIIGSMYLYFKPVNNKKEAYNALKYQLILLLLSGLIHPYITFMIIGFMVILPLKLHLYDKLISVKKSIIYIVISMISLILIWAIVGVIFNSTMSVNSGYGLYSWNFNSFINPDGFSSFLPQLDKYSDRQYEGYSYLGLGMMSLILISTFIIFANYKWIKKYKTLILIFLLWLIPLTLFGITNVITYNNKLLYTIPIPKFVEDFGSIFRASSRFIWLLYYTIFLGAIFIFIKSKINTIIKVVIMGLIFSLQFYDIKFLQTYRNLELGKYENPLNEKVWNSIFSQFNHVSFYPLYTWNLVNHYDYQDFGYIAYQNNATFTSAYAARTNFDKEQKETKNFLTKINNDQIDENTVYITNKENLSAFSIVILTGKAKALYIDKYYVVYSSKKNFPVVLSSENQKMTDLITTTIIKPNIFKKRNISSINTSPDAIKYNIEFSLINEKYAMFKGWASTTNTNANKQDSIFIVYNDNGQYNFASTEKIIRDDIGNVFKNKAKSYAGFTATIIANETIFKDYPVGIIIKDKDSNYYFQAIDKSMLNLNYNKAKKIQLPPITKEVYTLNLEKINKLEEIVEFFGWIGSSKIDNEKFEKSIIISNKKDNYLIYTEQVNRPDVQEANKNFTNGKNTGFLGKVNFNE
ncbi:DUF6311 domain-containing protein, partial [Algoriella sp.]|uniref:DUF6311 domain-containing protein n=1 Tax=Algoriella sp. TaxID=1872434 RepID=UPI001B0FF2E5